MGLLGYFWNEIIRKCHIERICNFMSQFERKGISELDGRLRIPGSFSSHVKPQQLWENQEFISCYLQFNAWLIQEASFESASILKSHFPCCQLQQLFPLQLHTCPVLTFRFVKAKQHLVEGKLPKYSKKCAVTQFTKLVVESLTEKEKNLSSLSTSRALQLECKWGDCSKIAELLSLSNCNHLILCQHLDIILHVWKSKQRRSCAKLSVIKSDL